MNLTQLANKLSGLTQQVQNIMSLGKRLDELPVRDSVDPDSKLLVSTDGVSETLSVAQLLTAASNGSQNNKVREVLLGVISDTNTFEEILDNTGISVESDELVFLSVFQPIENGSDIEQFVQRLFLWKLGKGNFSPIGSGSIDSKLFELPSIYPSEQTADEIISAPYAIVRDYGTVLGTDILSLINNNNPPVSYDEDTEDISYIYYVRVTLDDVKYLYQFKGTPGMYGFESGQMDNPDLTLIFSSNISGPVGGVSEAFVLEKMNEALENANDYTNYKLETLTTTVVPEGSRWYFTFARVLDTLLSDFTTISGPIVSTDSIKIAFGKAQNALNSLAFSVGLRELLSNKVQDFSSPSADTYPSTVAVLAMNRKRSFALLGPDFSVNGNASGFFMSKFTNTYQFQNSAATSDHTALVTAGGNSQVIVPYKCKITDIQMTVNSSGYIANTEMSIWGRVAGTANNTVEYLWANRSPSQTLKFSDVVTNLTIPANTELRIYIKSGASAGTNGGYMNIFFEEEY